MKRWLLQSGLFLAALLRRGGVEQNGKLTGKQLVVNLHSEIQITRVICVETQKKKNKNKNKTKKKKTDTTQQRSSTSSSSTIPEEEAGGAVRGGRGGNNSF